MVDGSFLPRTFHWDSPNGFAVAFPRNDLKFGWFLSGSSILWSRHWKNRKVIYWCSSELTSIMRHLQGLPCTDPQNVTRSLQILGIRKSSQSPCSGHFRPSTLVMISYHCHTNLLNQHDFPTILEAKNRSLAGLEILHPKSRSFAEIIQAAHFQEITDFRLEFVQDLLSLAAKSWGESGRALELKRAGDTNPWTYTLWLFNVLPSKKTTTFFFHGNSSIDHL